MPDRSPRRVYPAAVLALSVAGALILVDVGGPDGEPGVPVGPVMDSHSPATPSGDGATEGIKVHGHWTIEVREPDGELVERREFENALVEDGENTLIRLLARQYSVGSWSVLLSGSPQPCLDVSSGFAFPKTCTLIESWKTPQVDWVFATLTFEAPELLRILTLSGSATAQANGNVNTVQTNFGICSDPSIPPSTCPSSPQNVVPFTATTLEPIPVQTGQQILVTIQISFS